MKKWTKPELIILVRNKPEEAVLWVCKNPVGGSGSASLYGGCGLTQGGGWNACISACNDALGS
jgi:hypothetical protein